jgi:glycosyltransferase involved in cell wall biosynthesis
MKQIISIILPIYNGSKFINNLFDSMKNQTIGFDNLELIFINNKSTDNSLEIIKGFSEKYPNIKIINLEKHYPTPGHSRNMGILKASSEYIMFCDGDDSYSSDFCKTMYETITKENVDLVSSRYTVNIENKESFLNNSFLEGNDSLIKLDNIKEFPEVIQTQANLTIWNKIYKKDYLIKIISNLLKNIGLKIICSHWNLISKLMGLYY